MKTRTLIQAFLLLFAFCPYGYGQSLTKPDKTTAVASVSENQNSLQGLLGTWELDLRASPKEAPYTIDFTINGLTDNKLSGSFYSTPFTNGRINTGWGKVYFAFTTSDGSNTYYTSGYLSDGKLYGSTFTETRGFVMPWFSIRKK